MPNVFATGSRPALLTALVNRYERQQPDTSILYVPCHQVTTATDFLRALLVAAGQVPRRRASLGELDAAAHSVCRHSVNLLVLDGLQMQLVSRGEERRIFSAVLTNLMEAARIPFCCTGPRASLYACWADQGLKSRFDWEWRFY